MKYLALIFLLTGCQVRTLRENCTHRALSIEAACVQKYGRENVTSMTLENHDQSTYTYHKQIRVWTEGRYWWVDCPATTIYLFPHPNPKCKPPQN